MSNLSDKRSFHISDVLSASTGRLMSTRGMDGIYDILGFLSGDPYITTIGLVVVFGPAKESILLQHPLLSEIDENELDVYKEKLGDMDAAIAEFLKDKAKKYGEYFDLSPIQDFVRTKSDIDYITEVNPNIKVIGVQV